MGVGSNCSIHSTLSLPHSSQMTAAQGALLLCMNVGLTGMGSRLTGTFSIYITDTTQ